MDKQIDNQKDLKTQILSFGQRVSENDIIIFTRELAAMLKSGIHITQALGILSGQTKNKHFRQIIEQLKIDIEEGGQLSKGMLRYPNVFSKVVVTIVRSGEASGHLDTQLETLGQQLKSQYEFKSKVKNAMIYPALVAGMMIIIGILATVKIIPSLKDILLESGSDLPLQTKVVLAISDFLIARWYVAVMLVVAVIVGVKAYLSSPSGMLTRDRLLIREPSGMYMKTVMARFARIMGMLTSSGVPIVDAVRIVADAMGNQIFTNSLVTVSNEIERGIPMSVPLQKDKNFPIYVSQMVMIGEQTGQLDSVFLSLADYYEGQSDSVVKNITTILEPAIIVVVGLGVAFLVFAILMPIYNAATSIQ